MNKTELEKIKKLVQDESETLLTDFSCDEEDIIYINAELKEAFEDRGIEISIETLTALVNELNKDMIWGGQGNDNDKDRLRESN